MILNIKSITDTHHPLFVSRLVGGSRRHTWIHKRIHIIIASSSSWYYSPDLHFSIGNNWVVRMPFQLSTWEVHPNPKAHLSAWLMPRWCNDRLSARRRRRRNQFYFWPISSPVPIISHWVHYTHGNCHWLSHIRHLAVASSSALSIWWCCTSTDNAKLMILCTNTTHNSLETELFLHIWIFTRNTTKLFMTKCNNSNYRVLSNAPPPPWLSPSIRPSDWIQTRLMTVQNAVYEVHDTFCETQARIKLEMTDFP